MPTDLDRRIAQLEERAKQVHRLLCYASRAFVIEFAGTPKAGKSTSVEAIRHFFSRLDFRVHVLTERAALCPIPMKGHLFFNTWCAASMLAELLANVETDTDIIIVDRGIFDALVWHTLQEQRGELTVEEATTIESFLLLDRWRGLIDLVVVMNVAAEEALIRENSQRITQIDGSIMNPNTLKTIAESVDYVVEHYGPKFPAIIKYETTGEDVRESLVSLADRVLKCIEENLNPNILVVPRQEIEKLRLHNGGAFEAEDVKAAMSCISSSGQFMVRDQAENNFEYVQIIAAGILVHEEQVFLFKRQETDPKSHLYGRATIWRGAHVARRSNIRIPDLLDTALHQRISRSLFLSRVFPISALGYCWDRDDEISSRHFGMIYRIEIDNQITAMDLRKKEFRTQRGHGLTGQFVDWNQLEKDPIAPMLESWSEAAIGALKGMK